MKVKETAVSGDRLIQYLVSKDAVFLRFEKRANGAKVAVFVDDGVFQNAVKQFDEESKYCFY